VDVTSTPYQTAADREIDRLTRENERLTAERDDWRAGHAERFAELQAVCEDRDAQVDEVIRLRDIAWKWGNRAEEAEDKIKRLETAAQAVVDDPLLDNASDSWRALRTALARHQSDLGDVPW
jgi:hypothetical protein